jgi:hypothetical protein
MRSTYSIYEATPSISKTPDVQSKSKDQEIEKVENTHKSEEDSVTKKAEDDLGKHDSELDKLKAERDAKINQHKAEMNKHKEQIEAAEKEFYVKATQIANSKQELQKKYQADIARIEKKYSDNVHKTKSTFGKFKDKLSKVVDKTISAVKDVKRSADHYVDDTLGVRSVHAHESFIIKSDELLQKQVTKRNYDLLDNTDKFLVLINERKDILIQDKKSGLGVLYIPKIQTVAELEIKDLNDLFFKCGIKIDESKLESATAKFNESYNSHLFSIGKKPSTLDDISEDFVIQFYLHNFI